MRASRAARRTRLCPCPWRQIIKRLHRPAIDKDGGLISVRVDIMTFWSSISGARPFQLTASNKLFWRFDAISQSFCVSGRNPSSIIAGIRCPDGASVVFRASRAIRRYRARGTVNRRRYYLGRPEARRRLLRRSEGPSHKFYWPSPAHSTSHSSRANAGWFLPATSSGRIRDNRPIPGAQPAGRGSHLESHSQRQRSRGQERQAVRRA